MLDMCYDEWQLESVYPQSVVIECYDESAIYAMITSDTEFLYLQTDTLFTEFAHVHGGGLL